MLFAGEAVEEIEMGGRASDQDRARRAIRMAGGKARGVGGGSVAGGSEAGKGAEQAACQWGGWG